MNRRSVAWLLAAVAIPVLLLSACGDDDDDDGGSESVVSEQTIEGAEERAAAAEERPTEIAVSEPIDGEVPENKTVYWLECSIEACTQLGDSLQDATDALGWNLRRVNAGLEPETVKAAWELAAREKPDAVMASGFPHEVYAPELEEVLDAGIPVVNMVTTDEPAGDSEYILKGNQDYIDNGALNADWVVAQGGETTKALYVTTSQFPSVEARAKGFEQQFAEICPDCELDLMEVQADDIGTNALPTQIVGRLQQDPDINLVVLGIGDMLAGLESALQGAGLQDQAEILVSDMSPDIFQSLENGEIEASVMQEGVDMMWEATDILIRHFNDQTVDIVNKPAQKWIVTPEGAADWGPPFRLVEDHQQQYEELWGVG